VQKLCGADSSVRNGAESPTERMMMFVAAAVRFSFYGVHFWQHAAGALSTC